MQAVPSPGTERVTIEPLTCANCGAPIPLGDASTATCPGCGNVSTLPKAYVELREGARLADADRETLAAQYATASRPSPLLVRVWAWAGRFVMGAWGVATLCMMVAFVAASTSPIPRASGPTRRSPRSPS